MSELLFLLIGLVPREAPPPDYFSMMRELHSILRFTASVFRLINRKSAHQRALYIMMCEALDLTLFVITNIIMKEK